MIRPNHPPSPFPLLVSHVADSSHTSNDTMENQLRFSHNSRLATARTTSPQVLPLNGKSSTSSLPGSTLLKYRLQELRNELVHHLDTIQQIKTQIGHISTTMQVLAPLEQLEEQEFRRRQMRLRSTKKQVASEGDPLAQEASQTPASKKTVVVGRVKKVQQQAPSSLDSPTSIVMTSVPQRPSDDDEDENVATTENTEIEPSDAALMMMMNAYPQYYSTQSNNGSATEDSRASKRQRDEEEETEGETNTKQLQQDGEEAATEEQRAPQRRRRKMQKKDDDSTESNDIEGVEDEVEGEKNHSKVASHSSSLDSNPFGALIDAVDNEVTSGSDAPIIPRQPPRTPITPSLTGTPTPNLARLPLYRNESRGHPVGSPLQALPSSTLNRSPVGTPYSPIQQPMITLDPPVQPSKSNMCVMCKRANVNLKKGYSSRNYTEDYQAIFPTFKGEIGLVCGSCYMICYSYRSKKGKPSSTSPRTLHRLPNSVSHEHKNLGEVYSTPETVHRIISTEESQPLSPPPTELTPQVQIETQPAKASTSPKKTSASATTRTTGRRKRKPSEKRASLYDSDSDGI